MSARELGVTGDMPCVVNQEGDRGPIPQQLKEVMDLVSSMNQRIEDCAVEWQAKISQAQWRIIDAKPADNKPWEQSVLARTYFVDKILDDAFQGLLKHNKTFTDHLRNFIALIRGEQPTMSMRQTCNAQNQCSESAVGEDPILGQSSLLASLDISVLEKGENTFIKETDSNDILTKAQQSFTDLIKAKINFDTKFLGFESTLNGSICSITDASLGLCQICSKVLKCGTSKRSKSPTRNQRNLQLYKKKTRRSTRIKHKRLASKKTTLRSKEKKVSEKIRAEESAPDNSFLNDQSAVTTVTE